uniref:Septin-2 n=1 Tax=Cacopsylla melanoneura TaxID=428564 RepID=A0A8D8Y0N0_9HEMI
MQKMVAVGPSDAVKGAKNGTKISDALRTLKLSGHVGFDSLPDQLVNKSVLSGFIFNILCIGETGLGKSTLMDSLFNTSFESSPSPHSLPSVKLKAHTYELQENNVKLKVRQTHVRASGKQCETKAHNRRHSRLR